MAKDRAAPFSRKHRRYWIPVTGGMVLIGAMNVTLGFCTYDEPPPPEKMEVVIPGREGPRGTLGVGAIPAPVMRDFATRFPKTIPAGATIENGQMIVLFPPTAPHKRAIYTQDGTLVSVE